MIYIPQFTIKNFPDDVYKAVGQVIQVAQEWETDFKNLAKLLDIEIEKVDKASLNKLNDALNKEKLIHIDEYKKMKEIIDIRNNINHEFYMKDFQARCEDYDKYIDNLEKTLNEAQYLIYEANDFISNKIDKLKGSNIMRPTVFDNIGK